MLLSAPPPWAELRIFTRAAAMVSHPGAVTDLILSAAQATG
jgi:hypothetical protein